MFSKFSVKKPYTVLVGVVLAIVLGVVSFTKMTADLLPSISLPYVIVMTTYVGASPETVEMAVTKPIESSMATVSNIENISSVSSENYSLVVLEFAQSANMDSVSLEIRESLDQITSYWTDDMIGNPIIMKLNPDMLPVMIAAAGVKGMDVADVSAYVQEFVMPEIESIEGVASVDATGLIEENVNVFIRQEKVDAINEAIFASIDKEMEKAKQELLDSKQEVLDGLEEIKDGEKEINKGQKELDKGKAELESGKNELTTERDKTLADLSSAKNQLITAKADLEAMKISTNVDYQTLNAMLKGLNELDAAIDMLSTATTGINGSITQLKSGYAMISSMSGGDPAVMAPMIENLKQGVLSSELMQDATLKAALSALDWTTQFEEEVAGVPDTNTVCGLLLGYTATLQAQHDALLPQRINLQDNISIQFLHRTIDRTGKTDTQVTAELNEASQSVLTTYSQTISQCNSTLTSIDNGLIELEKGELLAAIEFANAMTQITLGERDMAAAQAELDAAREEMKKATEQLEDALNQIEDGEKELENAREDAFDQADMTKVLTVETISGLLAAQNFSMPAGYITEEGISYMVRIGDKPSDAEEMKLLPLLNLHMDDLDVITLDDVADVIYVDNSAEVYSNVNGSQGVILSIQKQTGYSTGEVSDKLMARFKEMKAENPDLEIITLMDQGVYIDLVMDAIINNILVGAALAIVILMLFLKDLRPTLVVAISIPISLVTAIVCMYFSGITLNVISLSGLALGIGMLVDNSIVVIENIYRLRSEGASRREAAIKGAQEVAGAIFASTLTTVCVFLPIVFVEGITRQLFVDMGLTIAYSLLASLLIALTVVPAMSSKMLKKTNEQKEGKLYTGLLKVYEKLLRVSLKGKAVVLLVVFALLAGSALLAISNGTAFMPQMDSTQLTVSVKLEEGATLAETAEVTDEVVALIREIPDVMDVGAMAGGGGLGIGMGSGGSTNSTSIYVTTYEDKELSNEEIADIIEEKTADLPAEISVETATMDMSALGGSGISIQIKGRDLDKLQQLAKEVKAIVMSVEGTENVSDGTSDSSEELRIIVDRTKAIEHGLTVAQVFQQVSTHISEKGSATTLVGDVKDYGVYVLSEADESITRESIKKIMIEGTGKDGAKVKIPFEDIATFEMTATLDAINRSEQTRYLSVSASIADGYNVGIVSSEVEKKVSKMDIPTGYRIEFAGENETINEALGQIGLMLVLALIFMYLIMVAQFQSLLGPFIIMFTIPLAFTGGFIGLFVTGSEVSVIALIGFVMLSGIIVNNGIVLIDYMNQLIAEGMEKKEAIIVAGKTRLRPVLMTALTTIMSLSALVFSNDMGSDMVKPMAIVTIGGLIYGTLLTLVVIPCVYDIFTKVKTVEEE